MIATAPRRDGSWSVLLAASPATELRIGLYPPLTRQAPHSHAFPAVSLMLAGTVREVVGSKEQETHSSWISVKPPDVRHSDAFGPDGALILSVVVKDPALWTRAFRQPEWRWRPVGRPAHREIVARAGMRDQADSTSQLAFDLLTLAAGGRSHPGRPPAWLRRVAQRLSQDFVPIARIATEAGVHPVYLARSFRRWYGLTPSAFRLQSKASAATAAVLFRDSPFAQAAQASGFADQSHMARTLKSLTGYPVSYLRGLAKNGQAA